MLIVLFLMLSNMIEQIVIFTKNDSSVVHKSQALLKKSSGAAASATHTRIALVLRAKIM